MLTNILSKICNYLNTNKIPEIIPYLIGKDLETYLNISDLYNIKLLNKELNYIDNSKKSYLHSSFFFIYQSRLIINPSL